MPDDRHSAAGAYTMWHDDGRFIYVEMSGRSITREQLSQRHDRHEVVRHSMMQFSKEHLALVQRNLSVNRGGA